MKNTLRCILSGLLLCMGVLQAAAQNNNNVWAFSFNGGLNFNSGAPQYFQTAIETRGNAASICNDQGVLMFYTDGNYVWDKNNNLMAGGTNLTSGTGPFHNIDPGNGWTADATAISMKPGTPNQYYIFSEYREKMDPNSGSSFCYPAKLYYSIVDMSANNGAGAVITSGNYLDSNVQKLTMVQGDNCDVWLLTHEGVGGAYKAYRITASGVEPPVISNTTNAITAANSIDNTTIDGSFVVSPDRRKLALGNMWAVIAGTIGIEVSDFDPATGIVSNCGSLPYPAANLPPAYMWFPNAMWSYACFSPDNTKLYAGSGYIAQYDLSASPVTGMLIGQVMTGTSVSGMVYMGGSDFKVGPDGKMYFHYARSIANGTPYPAQVPNAGALGVINNPNVAGVGCNISMNPVLTMPNTFNGTAHWPNELGMMRYADTIINHKSICFKEAMHLAASDTLAYGYTWQGVPGNPSIDITSGGLYVARYYSYNPCNYHIDSFEVQEASFDFDLGNDTTICTPPPFEIAIMVPLATYKWQDGSTANSYDADVSGVYKLSVTKNNCTLDDSIKVTFIDLSQNLGDDILLCKGNRINIPLQARDVAGASILWNDGSTNPSFNATDTGTYWVTVAASVCKETDSIHIAYDPLCYCYFGMPNAFSPNGDGLNDVFMPAISAKCPVKAYALYVYNRFGQRVFSSMKQDLGWDGTYNGANAETGTYMYEIRFTGGTRPQDYTQKGDVVLIR